jgi:spore coat protein U-like protein
MFINAWFRMAITLVFTSLLASNALAKTCTVTSSAVAFGVYYPMANTHLDSIGAITIECNGNIDVILSLDRGSGADASFARGRRMTTADGKTLRYNLYANASRTRVLGDGTGGTVTLQISGNKAWSQPIWARILNNQQRAFAGTYVDTIVVTISY